jgi:predicted RNA-binding protein with RPS1 domain
MQIKAGDVLEVRITKVSGYGCWGDSDGKIGFSHCVDWSEAKPVPQNAVPAVGQTIRMRVFRVFESTTSLSADITFDGTIRVDFQASPVVTEETWKRWEDHAKKA